MSDSFEFMISSQSEVGEEHSKSKQKFEYQTNKIANRLSEGKIVKYQYRIVYECEHAHADIITGSLVDKKSFWSYSLDGNMHEWKLFNSQIKKNDTLSFKNGIWACFLFNEKKIIILVNGEVFVENTKIAKIPLPACYTCNSEQLIIITKEGEIFRYDQNMEQTVLEQHDTCEFLDRPTSCAVENNCLVIGYENGRITKYLLENNKVLEIEQLEIHEGVPVIFIKTVENACEFSCVPEGEINEFIIIASQHDESINIINSALTKIYHTLFCGELQNKIVCDQYLIACCQTKTKMYKFDELYSSQITIKSLFDKPISACEELEENMYLLGNIAGDLEIVQILTNQPLEETRSDATTE